MARTNNRWPGGVAATLAVLAAILAVVGPASAGVATSRVSVFFVRGEQLEPVSRPGTTALAAVEQLVAGPTRAEKGLDFRTYLPAGTRVLGVSVADGIATVNMNERFASGNDPESLLARLSELVRTLTGPQGVTKVQLLIDGEIPVARFPGISTSRPITFRYLQTPNVRVSQPPETKLPAPDPAVKVIQQRLIDLGYLVAGQDDGRFGPATQNAILAFQKWERLGRTGMLDAPTQARLEIATHPTPITQGADGKRAEILLDRQVALLIDDNQVVRTIAVSSGKPSTPTPPGDYHVYAKIPRWWSTPFREWLPWALPFVGGIAFHQYQDVPPFPASHGCVRQSPAVALWTYNFATVGMPVKVIAKS